MSKKSTNPFEILNVENNNNSNKTLNVSEKPSSKSQQKKQKAAIENPCNGEIYKCLKSIYDYLLITKIPIFDNVFPFIQGGFALYLYSNEAHNYKQIMIDNPIVGTDDIDIHIEPISTTKSSYSIEIQKYFVKLSSKFKYKIDRNDIVGKHFYGTSKYIDITYDPNYISLSLYKEYCLNNGFTKESLNIHLNENIRNLLLPLDYVHFNCVHMFVLLLQAFTSMNSNNRVPKTLKILKRIFMIYNYEHFNSISKDLDTNITTLIENIGRKFGNVLQKKNIEEVLSNLIEFYKKFILNRENNVTKFLLYLIDELQIDQSKFDTNLQKGGTISDEQEKCFYTDNELDNEFNKLYPISNSKSNSKNKNNIDKFIFKNNIIALIFKNIIFNKMEIGELKKKIYSELNIINTNTIKKSISIKNNLSNSISVYGGYIQNNKTKLKTKSKTKSKTKLKTKSKTKLKTKSKINKIKKF